MERYSRPAECALLADVAEASAGVAAALVAAVVAVEAMATEDITRDHPTMWKLREA